MKRSITFGFVATMFCLFAPPKANAAFVAPYAPAGCKAAVTASGTYPYYKTGELKGPGWYLYCGLNPTTYESHAGDPLAGLPSSPGTSQFRNSLQNANVALYVFKNCNASAAALGAAQPAGLCSMENLVYGFSTTTAVPPATTPIIVVWEVVNKDGKPVNQDQMLMEGAVRHEAGHQIDQILGRPSTKDNPPSLPMGTVVKNDFAKAPPNVVGYYKKYYPDYFAPTKTPKWTEMFAEEFAIVAGGGIDPTNMDAALNAYWTCSRAYLTHLYVSGAVPPTYPEPWRLK